MLWTGASSIRTYGVAFATRVCEADNEVRRIKEELPQLLQEMRAYTQYWKQLKVRQEQLETALHAAAAAQQDAGASAIVQLHYQV